MNEELLKVLDLPEEEQYHALTKTSKEKGGWLDYKTICYLSSCRLSLADLGFRMRDKTVKKSDKAILGAKGNSKSDFYNCMVKVYCYIEKDEPEESLQTRIAAEYWWSLYSQPIHWIIAALIAEQGGKNEQDT